MIPVVNDTKFMNDMNNIVEYALGFVDGVKLGKPKMMQNFGEEIKGILEEYIDSNARVNPAELQHVYEWYQNGNPNARLFDISYRVSGGGISFMGTMSQSKSIKSGSNTPFYNKASIMENGVPVTITPKKSDVLVFESDGKTVFTRNPINVESPGGPEAEFGFENNFKQFFSAYLSQSLLSVSGIINNLSNPIDFKKNLRSGQRGGYQVGLSTGKRWVEKENI